MFAAQWKKYIIDFVTKLFSSSNIFSPQIVVVFYFGKSALNPIIYGWKNKELRRAFLRMLKRESSGIRRGSSLLSFFDPHHGSTSPNAGDKAKAKAAVAAAVSSSSSLKVKNSKKVSFEKPRCFYSIRMIKTKELDLTVISNKADNSGTCEQQQQQQQQQPQKTILGKNQPHQKQKIEIFKIAKQVSM